jgi:regulator of replication initiation timing
MGATDEEQLSMSNEITQWLAQIKELKQQLADSISDRNAAYESADNWRQLYNNEAQQRRTEASLPNNRLKPSKLKFNIYKGRVLA